MYQKQIDIGIPVPVSQGLVGKIGGRALVAQIADNGTGYAPLGVVQAPMTITAVAFRTQAIVADAEDHVTVSLYRVRGATATKIAEKVTAASTVAETDVAMTLESGAGLNALADLDQLYLSVLNESGAAITPVAVGCTITGTGATLTSGMVEVVEDADITAVTVEAPAAVTDGGSHVVVELYRVRSATATKLYAKTSAANFVAATEVALTAESVTNGTKLLAGDRLYATVQQLTGSDITPGSWTVHVALKLGLEPATTEYPVS